MTKKCGKEGSQKDLEIQRLMTEVHTFIPHFLNIKNTAPVKHLLQPQNKLNPSY
jgi:hypothetical protein